MKRYTIGLAILFLFGFMCFCFGAGISSQVITRYEIIKVPEVITETLEVPVYSTDFKYFASYAKLRTWLDNTKPEMLTVAQPDWKCQDYAWWLFEQAIKDGYLMAYYSIRPETYNGAFDRQINGAHAINSTFINNLTYLIEPQGLKVFPDFEMKEARK